MLDSTSTGAERREQFWFTLRTFVGCALLLFIFHFWVDAIWQIPDRTELGPKVIRLTAEPVSLASVPSGRLRIAGAWQVEGDDPRFGGISGLAVDKAGFVAINDSSVVVRFDRPSGTKQQTLAAELFELPDGPGPADFKRHRDSEGLVRDYAGRGWWVVFEQYDSLWLFDRSFAHVLKRVELPGIRTGRNQGIEAILSGPDGLLLIPEAGRWVVRLGLGAARAEPIANARRRISDAVRLQSGQVLVLERAPTLLGFSNGIAELTITDDGFVLGPTWPIPGRWTDNYEAMAVEQSGGRNRLWLMTDDNFDGRFRTLLIAVDLGPAEPSSGVERPRP